jgi:hypothetical protein
MREHELTPAIAAIELKIAAAESEVQSLYKALNALREMAGLPPRATTEYLVRAYLEAQSQ